MKPHLIYSYLLRGFVALLTRDFSSVFLLVLQLSIRLPEVSIKPKCYEVKLLSALSPCSLSHPNLVPRAFLFPFSLFPPHPFFKGKALGTRLISPDTGLSPCGV